MATTVNTTVVAIAVCTISVRGDMGILISGGCEARGRGKPRGERHGVARLTEEVAYEIKFSGDSVKDVAKRLGVEYNTAYHIRNGRSWKHLTRRGVMKESRRAEGFMRSPGWIVRVVDLLHRIPPGFWVLADLSILTMLVVKVHGEVASWTHLLTISVWGILTGMAFIRWAFQDKIREDE